MTGLRTEWGISMEVIHLEYSSVVPDGFRHIIDRFAAQGLLNISGDRIVSTEKGLYNADGMASELFSI